MKIRVENETQHMRRKKNKTDRERERQKPRLSYVSTLSTPSWLPCVFCVNLLQVEIMKKKEQKQKGSDKEFKEPNLFLIISFCLMRNKNKNTKDRQREGERETFFLGSFPSGR